MNAKEIIASLVSRAVKEAGLSPTELAKRSGIARRNIHYIAANKEGRSKHACRVDTLLALLAACGFELELRRLE